jgi:amidase
MVGVIRESLEVLGMSQEVERLVEGAAAQFEAADAEVEEVFLPMHVLGPAIWTVVS